MPDREITLREFKYFDRQIVDDFLSCIEGELATESKLSSTKKDSRLGAEVGVSVFKVKGERGAEDISNVETKTMGDAALFQRLYVALKNNCMINKCKELEKTPETAKGQILELEGTIEIPFFENLFEISRQLMPMAQPQAIDPNGNKVVDILAHNQTVNVRVMAEESKTSLVAVVQRRNLRVPIQELADEYKALYRVKRVLKQNEVFDVKLPVRLNPTMMNDLLKNSSCIPAETLELLGKNKQLSQEDLQIRYPAFVLTPIAIYQ